MTIMIRKISLTQRNVRRKNDYGQDVWFTELILDLVYDDFDSGSFGIERQIVVDQVDIAKDIEPIWQYAYDKIDNSLKAAEICFKQAKNTAKVSTDTFGCGIQESGPDE